MSNRNMADVRRKVKGETRYDFAFIPRKVIPSSSPVPIAHRHTSENREFVSPRQMAIVLSIVKAATDLDINRRDSIAKAAGAKAMMAEKEAIKRYNALCEAVRKKRRAGASAAEAPYPPPRPYKPEEAIRRAGERAYRKKFEELKRRPPPDEIEVTISQYKLLKQALLKPDSFDNIDGDLDRLCNPIGKMYRPLLVSWKRRPDRKISFRVSGAWLTKPIVKIPFPLPVFSPAATALWLFCWSIVVGGRDRLEGDDLKVNDGRAGIRFDSLCQRLGIPRKYGAEYNTEQLNRALEIVNDNLKKVSRKERIVGKCELYPRYDGYVRIVAAPPTDEQLRKPKPKQNKERTKPSGPIPKVARIVEPEAATQRITKPSGPIPKVARIVEPEQAPAEPEQINKPEPEHEMHENNQEIDIEELRRWLSAIPPDRQREELKRRLDPLTGAQQMELMQYIESERLQNKLKNQRASFVRFARGIRFSDWLDAQL